MFEFYVERDARAALELAKDNWQLQKGPEDAAILLRSALAAERADAARSVSEWRQRFVTGEG